MCFLDSTTGLDSKVSEKGKMKELAKVQGKDIPQFMEDAAATQ